MDATLEYANLTYEASFDAPLFDLPNHRGRLLSSLYESLEPVCPIQGSDMKILNGPSVADYGINISLFGGMASIKITTVEISITFDRLEDSEQIGTFKKCTFLTEKSTSDVFAKPLSYLSGVNSEIYISLKDGEDAGRFITQATDFRTFDLGKFNEAKQRSDLSLDLETEEWRAMFRSYRDFRKPSSFTIWSAVTFLDNEINNTSEKRFVHAEKLISQVFDAMGLNVLNPIMGE